MLLGCCMTADAPRCSMLRPSTSTACLLCCICRSVLQTIRQRWSQKLTEKGIITDAKPEVPLPDAVLVKR